MKIVTFAKTLINSWLSGSVGADYNVIAKIGLRYFGGLNKILKYWILWNMFQEYKFYFFCDFENVEVFLYNK